MRLNKKQTNAVGVAIAVMQTHIANGYQDSEVEEALDELIALRDNSELKKRSRKNHQDFGGGKCHT